MFRWKYINLWLSGFFLGMTIQSAFLHPKDDLWIGTCIGFSAVCVAWFLKALAAVLRRDTTH